MNRKAKAAREKSKEWAVNKKEALARDRYSCRKCGRGLNLTVHHILPQGQGGGHELENLCTLCESCHKRWHDLEAGLWLDFKQWLQNPPLEDFFTALAQQPKDMSLAEFRFAMGKLGERLRLERFKADVMNTEADGRDIYRLLASRLGKFTWPIDWNVVESSLPLQEA